MDYVEKDEAAVRSYNAINDTNFEAQDIKNWDKDIEVDLIMHGSPCFVAGTKIKTIDGFKNIEDIQVEDMVLTHTNTYQKVLKVGHNENKQIWELKSEDSDNITLVTGNHPFYIYTNEGNYKWKEIQYVTKSDKLCKIINNDIKHFAVISLTPTETYTTVYNIEVENDNSYTANGYIVHNCQDFSIASNQEGGDEGSGTRSSLMYETLRIVDKSKPKYVIWENVANLLSEKHKPNFEKYLEIMEEQGYNNYYQVLNAKDYGIPQNRKRVFTVSIRKDIDKKKFHFKPKQKLKLTLKDLLEANVDEKYYLSDEKINSISQWKSYQKPLESVLGNNSISPTLTARGAGEEHSGMITYSDKFNNTTNVQNLLLKKCIKYKGKEIELPAICASRGRNLDDPTNRVPGQKLQQTIEVNSEGISNTLTTVQKDTYVLEEDTRNNKQQLCDYMIQNDLVKLYDVINHGYTEHRLNSIKDNKDIVLGKNISPTLMTRPDELGVVVNSKQEKIQNTRGIRIRKLTPKECWRLMGFDDEDFDKAAKVCTEAQLYKQAGNSIVVNVLETILTSLFEQDINISFRFPTKEMLINNFKDYLQDDYAPNKVVLSEEDMKKVKGYEMFEADYGFGGSVLKDEENIYPTITASYGKVKGNSGKIKCKEGYRILTARECWRLMGFDDEDFDKAAKVCTEAQLYKQAGNSIVVNVLERICVNLFMNNKASEYRVYRYHKIMDYIVRGLLEKKEIDEIGNANIEFWTPNCSFFLTIEKYKNLKNIINKEKFEKGQVNQSAVRLLEVCLIKATDEGFTTKNAKQIDIDINEILQMLNKNMEQVNKFQQIKDDVKKQIRKDLQILKNVKIRFRTKTGDFVEIPIYKSTTILKKDTLHFVLNDTLNSLLKDEGKDILFPLDILLFNERYDPNVYLTYKKLLSELVKNDDAKIKTKDIYEYCITVPRIEEVKKTNRAYTQRIRMALENALNSICEVKWKYENKVPSTFKEWIESSIIVKKNEVSNRSKVS